MWVVGCGTPLWTESQDASTSVDLGSWEVAITRPLFGQQAFIEDLEGVLG